MSEPTKCPKCGNQDCPRWHDEVDGALPYHRHVYECAQRQMRSQAAEIERLNELVFAYESVNAPVSPLLAEVNRLRAIVDKLPWASIRKACAVISAADEQAFADEQALLADGDMPRTASMMQADDLQHCLTTLWAMREAADAAKGQT